MTHSTLIPLEGALNLRDIGGYAAEGGTIRRGIVFRSDNLNTLTDADLATIDELGIRSVFDFRGDREVELEPSRFWTSVSNPVRRPISGNTARDKTFVERVESREVTEVTDVEVGVSYVNMLERHGHRFARVLETITVTELCPILFHCSAGKDRTGLTAAIIHGVCGVSRDDIVHDFALSNTYRLPKRMAELRARFEPQGIDLDPLIPAISAPPQAMHVALDHLDSKYGSVEDYVTGVLGLDERIVETIRSVLIE